MPSILELFKKTPGVYSQIPNATNFEKVDGISSLKKVDTTPLSTNDTKSIDRKGIYYDPITYTSGVNYSSLDFTKKSGGEINIFSNDNIIGKQINRGFNKILGSSGFEQVRNNIEQDLNGIRISSGVERNNIQLYGFDAIRFARRSTTMMTIMRQDRGESGKGLIASVVQALDKGLSDVKGFLGFPQPANPSAVIRIGRRQRFSAFNPNFDKPFAGVLDSVFGGRWKGNEQKTMINIARIKNKTGGTEIGKLIKDSLGGDPKTVGSQLIGNGIQLSKEKGRSLLYNSGNLRENDVLWSDYGAYGSYQKSYSTIKEKLGANGADTYEDLLNQLDLIKRYSPVNGIERKEKPRLIGNAFTAKGVYTDKDQFGYTKYAFKKKNSEHDGNFWPKYSPHTRNDGKGTKGDPNNYTNKALVDGSVTPANPKGKKLNDTSLKNYRGIDYHDPRGQKDVTGDIIQSRYATPKYIKDNNIRIEPDGSFTILGQKYKDLVPLMINKIGETPTMFRTNITGLTENVTPTWNSNKFLGNPFNFYTYSGVERSVSFNLQIYAFSKTELQFNWEKLSRLTLMTYPKVSKDTNFLVTAPIIEFRLGDIYKNKKGFIESLSYTIPDTGLWETETDGSILPKFIDVSLTIKFIETRAVLDNPYNYNIPQQDTSGRGINSGAGPQVTVNLDRTLPASPGTRVLPTTPLNVPNSPR
jgi:hypothetical protein